MSEPEGNLPPPRNGEDPAHVRRYVIVVLAIFVATAIGLFILDAVLFP